MRISVLRPIIKLKKKTKTALISIYGVQVLVYMDVKITQSDNVRYQMTRFCLNFIILFTFMSQEPHSSHSLAVRSAYTQNKNKQKHDNSHRLLSKSNRQLFINENVPESVRLCCSRHYRQLDRVVQAFQQLS